MCIGYQGSGGGGGNGLSWLAGGNDLSWLLEWSLDGADLGDLAQVVRIICAYEHVNYSPELIDLSYQIEVRRISTFF